MSGVHPLVDHRPAATPAQVRRRGRRTDPHAVRRHTQLFGGLVLYAASIAMLVSSGLGNMPWDVLARGCRATWAGPSAP